MSKLESLAICSRTARLWADAIIKPVLIMMKFVRASRKADWTLHIQSLTLMLPYFVAAGHFHYLRYAISYLVKMTKLPKDLLEKLIAWYAPPMWIVEFNLVRSNDRNNCYGVRSWAYRDERNHIQ